LTGLAEGQYVVMAKAQFERQSDLGDTTVACTLEVGDAIENSAVLLSSLGTATATLPFLTPAVVPPSGAAILSCAGTSPGVAFLARNVKITAIQIDSMFVQR
jgi:hypothetical protein